MSWLRSSTAIGLPERVRWYVAMRWFFVLVLGAAGILPQLFSGGYNELAKDQTSILATGLAVNAIFFVITRWKSTTRSYYHIIAAAQVVFDLILASWLILLNGGIESRTVIVYMIPIIMAAALLGRVATYVTGVAAALLYALFISLDYFGLIQPPNITNPALHNNPSYYFRSMFFYSATLIVLAVITDFVGRLIRSREELLRENQKLSAAKAETEAILKSMGSGLVAVDSGGRITLVNDEFEKLTGWTKADALDRPIEEVLVTLDESGKPLPYGDSPPAKVLKQQPGITRQPTAVSDCYYRRKDGTMFAFSAYIAPIVVNNHVVGATTVFQDATASKDMEQLKNNFVAMVSHQLKTPLAEISGYIDNLTFGVVGKLTKKQTDYLNDVRDLTERTNKLISDLLDMSVIQRGNVETNIEPVKVTEIIEKVRHIYSKRLKEKGLSLEVASQDPAMVIMADKDVMVEVISNLILNAINYSKQSKITIKIYRDRSDGIIEVSDRGVGMSRKQIEDIFSKDDILNGAPLPESGSGIGLYLVKQFMLLQHGNISVKSETKEGTTFRINIPAKE